MDLMAKFTHDLIIHTITTFLCKNQNMTKEGIGVLADIAFNHLDVQMICR